MKALAACKKQKAKLVIAKLDRLSRNLAFIATLMDSGVEFVAVDNPHANKLTIHILAAVAQHEREIISARTSAALKAAKARGKRLGNPKLSEARRHATAARKESADRYSANVLPVIREIQRSGIQSFRGIARALAARGPGPGGVGQFFMSRINLLKGNPSLFAYFSEWILMNQANWLDFDAGNARAKDSRPAGAGCP